MKYRPLIRLCAVLLVAAALTAQVETSTSIRGLITDSTGASVPEARVTIRNTATAEERSATSDSSGSYAFPSVVPGRYDISVTHPGFKRGDIKNRMAQVAQSAQVDVVLQVGEVSESVTVSAEGAELISTSSAEVSGTIVNKLVQDLPLNGRNFFDLATVLPHVSLQNISPQSSFAGFSMNPVLGSNQSSPLFRSSGIYAAGNRDSATNVSIDGVNVQSSVYRQTTPQQPPSAIQEVKIHVSSTNAEFGNGAAAVNVITKGGSNQFHGEVYEYLHNDKTDANYFFNNLSGRAKNAFRQNQFGGALGGPAIRNKLFFFGAFEALRVRQSSFSMVTVPPDELRNGDFSNFLPPGTTAVPVIYNPYNYNSTTGLRVPFPGNRIPLGASGLCAPRASCGDAVTLKFMQDFIARPNTVIDGIPRFVGDARQRVDSDQGTFRVDWTKSERDRVYGRFSRTVSPSANQPIETLAGLVQNASDMGAALHWTRTISASTVNDLLLGYAHPRWLYGRDPTIPNVASGIGLANTSGNPGGPGFSVPGYSMNASLSFILYGTDNLYQLGDDITHVRGRHNFKFGFQAIERRFHYPNHANDKGSWTFSDVYTRACPLGNATCETARVAAGAPTGGNAFGSYLLGVPLSGLFQLISSPYRGYTRYYGGYAQDSWRVSTKLTLNYGLRYEYWSPWRVPRNNVASFNEVTGDIIYALQNPLDYYNPSTNFGRNAPINPGVPREAYRTSKGNFAPRVGLAYTVTPSTVFRVGWGMYYDGNNNANQVSDIQSAVGPFRLRYEPVAASGDQLPQLRIEGNYPFPNPTSIPQKNATPRATFRFAPGFMPVATVQEWSASIQQRIGNDWAAEASYQGTHAIHLLQFTDVNPPALPVPGAPTLGIDARRKFPFWGVVGAWRPIGYGRYNALGGSLRNNNWHGLTYLSSFTYAKNIVSAVLGTSDQGNAHGGYPYIWEGAAEITPRLRYVNSLSYDLPFGPGKWLGRGSQGVAGKLLGGWNFSTIVDMTTGAWRRVTTTTDTSNTNYGVMPDRTCDPRNVPGGQSRLAWFNTACFAQPAFGVFGNSPIGVYEDPGLNNWNMSFSKSTTVGFPNEGARIEFRTDLFNAFNHTQWGNATNQTLPSNVNAGRILGTRPPRQMQFSLSFQF